MQEEMRLQDYIRISFVNVWKNKFLIVAVTLLFLLIGILYASWQTVTNTYYAKATVYTIYGDTKQESSAVSEALTGYSDIVTSKKICERAEALIGDANINANMIRNMISASYNKSATVMTIAAYSDNRAVAVKVANAVAEAFVIEVQSITGSDRIQMLDRAEDVRMSSNGLEGMIKTIMMAGIAGFAISILVIVAIVIFSNKIKSVEQCLDEDEGEILGMIPFVD